MPFKSKAQARAAFGGYLGPEMKRKAPEFAHATPDMKSLPAHVSGKGGGGSHASGGAKKSGYHFERKAMLHQMRGK